MSPKAIPMSRSRSEMVVHHKSIERKQLTDSEKQLRLTTHGDPQALK